MMKRTTALLTLFAIHSLLLFARVPDEPDFSDNNGLMYKFYRDEISGHLLDGYDGEVLFWGLSDRMPEVIEKYKTLKVLRIPATVRPSSHSNGHIFFDEDKPLPVYRVTSIGENAFRDFPALEEIVLPEGITYINPFAMGDTPAKKINIPASMKDVYPGYFYGYEKKWETVTVAKGNPNYSSVAGLLYSKRQDTLWACPQAHRGDIKLPATVRVIHDEAFRGSYNVRNVTLPNRLTYIGKKAFSGSTVILTHIPGTVKDISEMAFFQCKNIKQLTVGEGLETIGEGAFSCSTLERITLPSTLKEVGKEAFYLCSKLRDVVCKAAVPPVLGQDALKDVDLSRVVLHVPAKSVDTYRTLFDNPSLQIVAIQ